MNEFGEFDTMVDIVELFDLVEQIKIVLLAGMCYPKSKPKFQIREEVARDKDFQEWVGESMREWNEVREQALPVIMVGNDR